ncbi:MAG: GNAT family N-acetyltransferase [Dehalococcoidia bacterium]
MTVTIELVPLAKKPVLWRLLQLYIYDFTEFDAMEMDDEAVFAYRYFDEYWAPAEGEQRHPYFIRVDGALAGFAMVRTVNGANVMSEFFVMKRFRRGGVGREAVKRVLKGLPGKWIVHEHPANLVAQEFWPRVIGEVTGGRFEQQRSSDGALTQRFTV